MGARRLRSLSVTGFPSASVLGWQSSRLPTDYVGMAEVSRRARGAQPCPRHVSAFGWAPDLSGAGRQAPRCMKTRPGRLPAAVTGIAMQPTMRSAPDNRAPAPPFTRQVCRALVMLGHPRGSSAGGGIADRGCRGGCAPSPPAHRRDRPGFPAAAATGLPACRRGCT